MTNLRKQRERNALLVGLCIEACYDNPLFDEDGKYPHDMGGSTGEKLHPPRANDYHVSPDILTNSSIRFKSSSSQKRTICVVLTVIVLAAAAALLIGLLVHFLGDRDEHLDKIAPDVLFKSKAIQGSIRIDKGPYSVYRKDYDNSKSQAYQVISQAFLYYMSSAFTDSKYSKDYNSTQIISIKSGSVIINYRIHFSPPIEVTSETEKSLKEILETRLIVFTVEKPYISLKAEPVVVSPITTTEPSPVGKCVDMTLEYCVNQTTYSKTTFPNIMGHMSPTDSFMALAKYADVFQIPCYEYGKDFWCSVWAPECKNGKKIPPCMRYCEAVKTACDGHYSNNMSWPIQCSDLPDSDDPNICRQNPYKPGKCVKVKDDVMGICIQLGFNETAYPNYIGGIGQNSAIDLLMLFHALEAATQCYKYATYFACAAMVPKCSGTEVVGQHTIPPCRSLCQGYRSGCEIFMDIFRSPWPSMLNCSAFPDVNDTSVCIGYAQANEPPSIPVCKKGEEISCDDNVCIPISWICDGYQDCADNSDEQSCAKCEADETICHPTQCVKKNETCDGRYKCYKHVDEAECVTLGNGTHNGIIQVMNGVTGQWEQVCSDNWNITFSSLICNQLGYKHVYSYVDKDEIPNTSKAILHLPKQKDTEDDLLQSYLKKGSTCPSRKVVSVNCSDPVCGIRPAFFHRQTRIVGGPEVNPGTWPSMVSLHGGPAQKFFCGGSIIHANWILTAAHCIGGKTTGTGLTLKMGAARRDTYSEVRVIRPAKAVYVHPQYNGQTVDNDIALIEIEEPLNFNDYIRPVCLPKWGHKTPVGTRCYAVGWGKTKETNMVYSRAMREVNLNVVSNEVCNLAINNSTIKTPYVLTHNMMCAGGGIGHDACSGDSGGPLMCPKKTNGTEDVTWYVAGITSWGLGCAIPNVPGVYAQVVNYLDWIRNTTRHEVKIS